MKAAQKRAAVGKVINVGSGQEISIGQLASQIIKMLRSSAKIVVDESRVRPNRSEVNRLLADNRLAKETLGWGPQVSLEEGLKRTMAWIATHLNRFQVGKYQI
jgi:Nucleoside-diphosphate-sugar epimerases